MPLAGFTLICAKFVQFAGIWEEEQARMGVLYGSCIALALSFKCRRRKMFIYVNIEIMP